MKPVYIYTLKHPETKEVRYIGLTRYPKKRLHNEINYPHSTHLRNWIGSLKADGLNPIMEIIEETIEDDACAAERKWILVMKARGCRLINLTDGGESGFTVSDETREKLRILNRRKRRPMSTEHKMAIGAANKGQRKPWSSARIIALNKSRAGIPLSDSAKGKLREYGKRVMVGERLAKLVEGGKNHPRKSKFTDEQKAEIKFLIREGYSYKVISDMYGLTVGTISCIKRGEMWISIQPEHTAIDMPPFKRLPTFRNSAGKYQSLQA